MNLNTLKSLFRFNKSDQAGILFLGLCLLIYLSVDYYYEPTTESKFFISTSEIEQYQRVMDSIKCLEEEKNRPKIYPFNPNFMTDYKAYTLGIKPEEFDRLKTFRARGSWVNSAKEFQNVTKVSDSILDRIRPFFKFPEWVKKRRHSAKKFVNEYINKMDLNTATLEDLQEVYGVGPVLGTRILEQRKRLGSFHDLNELQSVWGLNPEVIENIKERFEVATPREVKKMNVNAATASDIATIPGINFSLAKKIWEFVRVRNGLGELSELSKIEGITARKLQLIELYLFAE